MRQIELPEAISIAREKRALLVRGAEIIAAVDNNNNDTYLKLQDDIDRELDYFGNLGWVHKYYHMLYPEKIGNYHSIDWQVFYLIKMQEKPIKSDGRYALDGQYMRAAKKVNMIIIHFTAALAQCYGPPHNYWRVGTTTTDGKHSYWTEMYQNGYVCVGWPALAIQSNGWFKLFRSEGADNLFVKIRQMSGTRYPCEGRCFSPRAY